MSRTSACWAGFWFGGNLRRLCRAVVVVVGIAAWSSLTYAQPADAAPTPAVAEQGLQLDLGLSVGSPYGQASQQTALMSKLARGVAGTSLALGYRHDRFFFGGVVFGGIGSPAGEEFEACSDAGALCRASSFRYGLQARVYVAKQGAWEPWFGPGMGREVFSLLVVSSTATESVIATGPERLSLRLGVDVATARKNLKLSAFADYALGQFDRIMLGGENVLIGADQRTVHHWISIGAGLAWMP